MSAFHVQGKLSVCIPCLNPITPTPEFRVSDSSCLIPLIPRSSLARSAYSFEISSSTVSPTAIFSVTVAARGTSTFPVITSTTFADCGRRSVFSPAVFA